MVRAARSQKSGVSAALHNLTPVEKKNLVGMNDGGQPVGDHEHCSPPQQTVNCFLHQSLRLGVQRRSRLVQDQNGRITEQGPCNRQPLLCPPDKRVPLSPSIVA